MIFHPFLFVIYFLLTAALDRYASTYSFFTTNAI